MDASLAGRVAVVTGAGRGIGRATAIELARMGAAVVVNDVDGPEAERVAAEISAAGGRVLASVETVARYESAGRIIAAAIDGFGGVDILVNNAGLSMTGAAWDTDPSQFDTVVASHLHGAFYCTRHAAPHMKAKGWGRIVNLVSRGGITGIAGNVAYGAGKGGIFGLTNVTCRDLGPFGITVNGVNPASTATRMVLDAIAELRAAGGERATMADNLLAIVQPPERVATLIAGLCTDAAASINGQYFLVSHHTVGLFQPLTVTQSVTRAEPWTPGELVEALGGLDLHPLDAPY